MKNNKGFSLVELIVVIAIMAILAAIAIPTFAHFITKANQASDAELLHNINYILNASCIENGVDIKDVTSATWDKNQMLVTEVKVNGVANADIVASFALHFGELKNEEFKYIEDLRFDVSKHEFVDAATENSVSIKYGNSEIKVNPNDIAALNNSTFGKIGMEALLNQLNDVTILASGMTDKDALKSVLSSDDFRKSAAAALNVPVDQLDAEVERLATQMVANDTTGQLTIEDARNRVLANAAVLYSAQQTTKMPENDLNAFLEAPSKSTILENMETNPGVGLAQASLICGLYTSYIQTDAYKAAHPNEPTPTVDAPTVLNALETDAAFKAYLKGEGTGADDLNGYLASLNMINGSTQNSDAVSELIVNGFNDPALVEGMNGLTNQN